MNKTTLRLLFLTGLTAIFCASCSKDKDFPDIPDSYPHNDTLPFSVEAVPPEGCDTLIFYRIKRNDSIKTTFNPTDASLKFKTGDSIIMETRAKSGYTFINWARNGKGVSSNPIYGFKLDTTDIDKLSHVKYHYEARFGLDYALQVIPPIDSVIPAKLIKVMGPYLHFGDNPPLLYKMNADTILGFYAKNPTLLNYYAVDSTASFCEHYFIVDPNTGHNSLPQSKSSWDYFLFHDQHRCIAQLDYKCTYVDTTYIINGDHIDLRLWDITHTYDSVFIMGNPTEFTAFFHQHRNHRERYFTPNNYGFYVPDPSNYGSHEAVILSGKVTDNGIKDLYFGIMCIAYDDIGTPGINGPGIDCSNIGDIIVFHHDFLPFSYWDPNK